MIDPTPRAPAPPEAPAALYARAVESFHGGRLAEAEKILRDLVASAPEIVEALQLLGAALGAQGRAAEALSWLDRARALRPGSPTLLQNRAQALFTLGRFPEARGELDQALGLDPALHAAWNLLGAVLGALADAPGAERAYRRALALKPDHAQTHYNLALLFQEGGRLDEAIAGYRKALSLQPGFAAGHNNLANALKVKGRIAEALKHYAEAVRLDPLLADAFSNFGTALRESGRVDEAIPLLEQAARLKPESEAIQNNLGIAYYERNRFTEAIACYRRALARRADYVEALNNLGNALSAAGQEGALECYRAVLFLVPEHADAHSNLGLLLQERGATEEAVSHYERALAIRPDHPDALNNLGYFLQEQGRRAHAMALYRRALEANPQATRAAYNLGLAQLYGLEFERGWELLELRFHTAPPIAVARSFRVPQFTRADFGGAHRVAVWREQGVGDQLLYATLLPELEARGEHFVVEVDARLMAAFARAHPDWAIVSPEQSQAAFASCDRHLPLGSLPMLFRPTLESFGGQPRALLSAEATRARSFRDRLAIAGTRLIGISWRSFQPAARGYMQRKKSASLEAFLPLARRGDLRLLDLQYGDTTAERAAFGQGGGRLERLEELDLFNDLDGVLAAIEACDLVVTTSNVTAHLAGVLGKPAWLVYLRSNPPFHYWASDANGRSLWYPSIRILTAPEWDTWEKTLGRVDELLDA